MKRVIAFLAMLAWLLPAAAQASPVVADISTYRVAMDAGFTGIRLFVFGARNEPGDVIVVIRGPERDFIVRKKERIAGMWVNSQQLKFKNVPEFYTIAAASSIDEMGGARLLRNLRIGSNTLLTSPPKPLDKALFPEFSKAFFEERTEARLYTENVPLSFMGETLFKAVIPFPDTIPKGDYTAEIYLVADGELVGMQSMPIRVEKSGFDAFVYDLAHSYPLVYGLIAIGLALGAGWGAARIFDRN